MLWQHVIVDVGTQSMLGIFFGLFTVIELAVGISSVFLAIL